MEGQGIVKAWTALLLLISGTLLILAAVLAHSPDGVVRWLSGAGAWFLLWAFISFITEPEGRS